VSVEESELLSSSSNIINNDFLLPDISSSKYYNPMGDFFNQDNQIFLDNDNDLLSLNRDDSSTKQNIQSWFDFDPPLSSNIDDNDDDNDKTFSSFMVSSDPPTSISDSGAANYACDGFEII